MKRAFVCMIVVMAFGLGFSLVGQDFTYVGAAKCAMCHKTEKQGQQYPLWQQRKHSQSLTALTSPQAAEYAKQANVQNPAESPDCLKCHAPLYEKAAELKSEGVTCEVCHGPGSEYKKLSVMKDLALATKNGLIAYDSPDAIKKQCLTCHESAHGKSFDFASAFEKVKHAKPAE